MTSVTVVIVSWNSATLLRKCLATVRREAQAHPWLDLDVFVVDNASSDESQTMVGREFPEVTLVANSQNVGFARANNQVFHRSVAKYVMLLNPDTELLPGAIAELVHFLEGHPGAGAAGSMLIDPQGAIQPAASPMISLGRELWRMCHLDSLYPLAVYPLDKWDHGVAHIVGAVQGASMIIRREALEQVGALDPSFFMFTEEVDLCYRLARAGWQVYWVPKSKVIHHGGQSTKLVAGPMFIELYRSKTMFVRKHYGLLAVVSYKLILAATALPRVGIGAFQHLLGLNSGDSPSLASRYLQLLAGLPRF